MKTTLQLFLMLVVLFAWAGYLFGRGSTYIHLDSAVVMTLLSVAGLVLLGAHRERL